MAGIKCLYCSANNKESDDICQVCGLPLSMSLPVEPVAQPDNADASSTTANNKKNAVTDAIAKFQESRAEMARQYEQESQSRESKVRIYVAIAGTLLICTVGVLLISNPAISNSVPDTVPVVLDQSVGAEPISTATQSNNSSNGQQTSPYSAAEEAFNQQRWDDAEKLLAEIKPDNADYQKAAEMKEKLSKIRNKKK